MEWLSDPTIWAAFFSLTALEIVLGIDNVVFIALVVGHLPEQEQARARSIGLMLALLLRIGMLFGAAWVIGLTDPWVSFWGFDLSGKALLMLIGGLFLLYKATDSIHDELTGDISESYKAYSGGIVGTIVQIMLLDMVFSFDSVITAVGITDHIYVIIVAMTIAMGVMLFSAGFIADFIKKMPTVKMLALSFVMMIGFFLVAEGFGVHVPKGYLYFGMAFSLFVEVMNLMARRRRQKKVKAAS